MVVPPSTSFNWDNLSFDLYPVAYEYKDGVWDKGTWVTEPYVKLHIGSVALNYGQSVFEGLKAFRDKQGNVRIFRPKANAARMNHSGDIVSLPELPEDIFVEGCLRAVAGNLEFVPPYAPNAGKGALYVRPLYFGSGENLLLSGANSATFIVYVTPVGALYGGSGKIGAVDGRTLDDFDRTAPLGTGNAKLAGNYAPVFKHTAKAKKEGYGITLHRQFGFHVAGSMLKEMNREVDSKTRTLVDEFSTSNALFIKEKDGKVTLVVPKSNSILKSITTDALMQISEKSLGWAIEHRPVAFQELIDGVFSECAASGTAAALTPVRTMTHSGGKVSFGDGQNAGPYFTKLFQHLTALQSGDIEDTLGFTTLVEPRSEP